MIVLLTVRCCSNVSYLDSGFTEIQPEGEFFSREDVRIVRLFKGPLQLMQLKCRECCPAPPDLLTILVLTVGQVLRWRRGGHVDSVIVIFIDSNVVVGIAGLLVIRGGCRRNLVVTSPCIRSWMTMNARSRTWNDIRRETVCTSSYLIFSDNGCPAGCPVGADDISR